MLVRRASLLAGLLLAIGSFAAPARAARPLPQSGVLASNFVGGHGVQTRLSDLLDRGVMVDGHNVRLEAFAERGRLPYAVPSREAVAMHADVERTRVDAAGDVVHLQVALLARQGEAPPRPRMDIRLVLAPAEFKTRGRGAPFFSKQIQVLGARRGPH